MSKIKIAELFYSIQGEGRYMGVPSVFLRTFGCNFKCAGFGMSRLHTDGKARLASIRVRCCSTATSPANGIPVRPVSSQTPVRVAQRNTMPKAPCCKTHFAFSYLGRGRSTRTVGRQGNGARKRWSLRTCTIAKTVSS